MGEERRPDTRSPDGGLEAVLERTPKTKKPRLYKVLLHDDDYTTMEFVVWVLEQVFHKSESEATRVMLTIHHKDVGVAGVFTRDIAETKVAQVSSLAEEHDMPLLCTSEPET